MNTMVSSLDSGLRRVAVITHFYSSGPAHELVDYLVPRVHAVTFFGQPLSAKATEPSFYRSFHEGKLITERTGDVYSIPDFLRYIKDFFSVVWFLAHEPRFDLVVALDPLNATAIRIGRIFNWFPNSVYYTIDYIPHRFGSTLLNRFYHWLDRLSVVHNTWTWNLSPRMTLARAKRWNRTDLNSRQLTVPMGTHELKARVESRELRGVVFMGHLRVGQGVERLIDATALAVKQISDLQVTIVGGGELLDQLEEKAKKLGLEAIVTFTGFVAKNDEMRQYLLKASLAVALYENSPDNYTQYTDPGKPKEYLAAGLPVLISDVPAIAREIEAAGAGLVIDDSADALATAMVAILKDSHKLAAAQTAALKLAATFRWNKIFDQAFEAMRYVLPRWSR